MQVESFCYRARLDTAALLHRFISQEECDETRN